MNKTELEFVNIAFSPKAGSEFLLILQTKISKKFIPIMVGKFEAQTLNVINHKLDEKLNSVYKIFLQFIAMVNYNVLDLEIINETEGIFKANINLININNQQIVSLNCRCTDAIAFSLITKKPIYIFDSVLEKITSVDIKFEQLNLIKDQLISEIKKSNLSQNEEPKINKSNHPLNLEDMDIADLKEKLKSLLKEENYLLAAKIRDIINSKNSRQND